MATLAERLEELERLYRGFDRQLEEWIASGASAGSAIEDGRIPGGEPPDPWLARLSRLEEAFIRRARVLGDAIEEERRRISRRAGRDLSLREAAARPGGGEGATAACDRAAAAVTVVARRRVEALRRLETFRTGVAEERGKVAAARRLGKMYGKRRERGRRVDGRV